MAPGPDQGGLIAVRTAPSIHVLPSVAAEILSAVVEVDFQSNGGAPPPGSLLPRLPAEYEALRRPFRPVFMHGLALREAILLDLEPTAAAHQGFSAFDRHLAGVSSETWVGWAAASLYAAAAWRSRQPDRIVPGPPPPAALTLFEAARDCAAAVIRRGREVEGMPDADPDTAARLVTDGAMLAAHVRRMATLLWDAIEPQWSRALPALGRLSENRARGPLPTAAADLFGAVTGLQPLEPDSEDLEALRTARCIAFFPVLHGAGFSAAGAGPGGRAFVIFEVADGADAAEPPTSTSDPVPLLAAAADPFRWRVLDLLAHRGPLHTQDILAATSVAQSTASRHLRELEQAGLVRVEHDGRRARYALDAERLRGLVARLEDLAAERV